MKDSKKDGIILVIIALIVIGLIFGVVYTTKDWGKTKDSINAEKSLKQLNKLYSSIEVRELTPQKDYEYTNSENYSVLPDISEYGKQIRNSM